MKLKIGEPKYPHKTPFVKATIRGWRPEKAIHVLIISMKDMEQRHKEFANRMTGVTNIRGIPSMIAFDPERKIVLLFPVPDAEYELDLFEAPKPIEGTITMPGKKPDDVPRPAG